MATAKTENLAISFQDIVQLCLATHSPDTGRRLSFTARMSERRKGEGIVILSEKSVIPGRLFDPVETICKNMIGNIFAHSGLGREVRGELELIIARNRMTIIATNTLSIPRHRVVAKMLAQLQQDARAPLLSKAGEDSSSGFSKMAWACNRAFGVLPHISVAIGSPTPTFTITVDVSAASITFE